MLMRTSTMFGTSSDEDMSKRRLSVVLFVCYKCSLFCCCCWDQTFFFLFCKSPITCRTCICSASVGVLGLAIDEGFSNKMIRRKCTIPSSGSKVHQVKGHVFFETYLVLFFFRNMGNEIWETLRRTITCVAGQG